MMRAHPPSHACGSPVLWFLGLLAAVVVLVQASWLNSLRASLDNYRALANSSAFTLLDNGSVAECLQPELLNRVRDAVGVAPAPAPAALAAPGASACARAPPRVLLVTAEQPSECSTATAQWLGARAMRNRLHYAQRHRWQLYWNTDTVDPEYQRHVEEQKGNAMWNKASRCAASACCTHSRDSRASRPSQPALLNKLLHSSVMDGIEWMFWIDSDAFFMAIDFQLPLDEYDAAGYNLVLWGEPRMVDDPNPRAPSYFGLNAGVMLMRNNDWTRAFLGKILEAGADLAASTATQGAVLKGMCDRAYDCVVSDQSTIVYLLNTQPELWRRQTLLEKRFTLNGHWSEFAGHLVSGSLKLQDSIWASDRVPFVMHFAGCQLCSGRTDSHYADWNQCRDAMSEALNHAEDWSLAKLGLKHANLSSLEVVSGEGPPSYPEPEGEPDPPLAEGEGSASGEAGTETTQQESVSQDVAADSAVADAELQALAPPQRP